jgi:hypothetical protein
MKKDNSHDKISETLSGIEFFRTLKTQAPQGNELISDIIEKTEKALMEQLFQLSCGKMVQAKKKE